MEGESKLRVAVLDEVDNKLNRGRYHMGFKKGSQYKTQLYVDNKALVKPILSKAAAERIVRKKHTFEKEGKKDAFYEFPNPT